MVEGVPEKQKGFNYPFIKSTLANKQKIMETRTRVNMTQRVQIG